MMDLPEDQEIRERALSPGESFHLEAPAGSGKTSVLLARFLTLLTKVEAPEELLALTFTRKAAGELRTRVMQLLWRREELGPEANPWERELTELAGEVWRHFSRRTGAVQEILAAERLPIMTFHSFCAQLLRYAPQEAGLPLDFQLLEDNEAEWLKEEALEELRRRLAPRPAQDPVRLALVRRLVRLNNDWPRLARELRSLVSRRDGLKDFLKLAKLGREPGAYEELLGKRYQSLLRPVLDALKDGLGASDLGREWPDFWENLQGSSRGEGLPPRLPGSAWEDLPGWQAIARVLLTDSQGELRKQLTPNYGFPAGLQNTRWPEAIQALPPSLARRLKQCRELTLAAAWPEEVGALQDLVILLGEALKVYEELCAQRRSLDFLALEQAALGLLTREAPSDLMLRLDWRLTNLLVDEFQDTSEAQMDLLCQLLAGWEAGAGRTLMVVGDPKQSIYEWRQAKVRLFQESRRGLPCSSSPYPLIPLLLTTNFRASRTLIAWANQVFGDTVMKFPSGPEGVPFHAAAAGPGALEGGPPNLAMFSGDDNAAARQAEARWLARQVAQAVARRREGETIGILLFTRKHLATYLQALSEASLAVKVREGLKLSDSRVVRHLHNLARALVRPQDEVAWAALLRGPWTRLSLNTLTQVALTPGEVWPEKLRRFAAAGTGPPDLPDLVLALTTAQGHIGRRPLAEILGNWLDEVGAWAGIASWGGPAGVANARAYLDLLAEAECGLPEATFLKAAFNLEQAFQPPDPRSQDSPVEILTVHGAKGLEFNQVFVPHLDWQPLKGESQAPPFLLEEIPGTRLHGLALARPYIQEKQSSLYLLLKNLKDRRVLDEARRVFYVAVTRARERLVLSGVIKRDRKGGLRPPPEESPLGWLWQHYAPPSLVSGVPQVWPGPEIQVELFTQIPALKIEEGQSWELPRPWIVELEPEPYRLEFPSQLKEMGLEAREVATGEAGETARLRGEVIHRLLQTLSQGKELPGAVSVAAALRQEGMPPEAALRLAAEILAEVEACRQEAFLAPLLSPDLPDAMSEWRLEDLSAPGTIRRGLIDRLVFDGAHWWLLDYKSSRPEGEEDWESFIARETEKYRPQLLAYREMAARAKGLDPPGTIKLALYFTACQRAVVI